MMIFRERNVVLGAGAVGLATAYHLARRGEPVTLIEQFALGHDRGSSHGAGRITRHSYADPAYARLMPEAFRAWKTLEADSGRNLYLRTGGVSLCPEGVDYVARVAAALDEIGVPHRRMDGRELRSAWPAFDAGHAIDAVFEPDAGVLAAADCLAAEREVARRLGGDRTRILENCPIRRVDLQADRPTLFGDDVEIVADRLVVAAGPWVSRLLPQLPEPPRPTRQQIVYLRPPDPAAFQPGRFPVFIVKGRAEGEDFYGMPEFLGQGVKVARHGGPDIDPDRVDRTVEDVYRGQVRAFLRDYVPGLADAPIDAEEVCLYTVTADDRFQVGPWPGRPDVLVASPCSGHGFKFSCLIGSILADLVTCGPPRFDLTPWRLDRAPSTPAGEGPLRRAGIGELD